MWRPENWPEAKPKKLSKGIEGISEPNFDYGVEAGADAMLGILREQGKLDINQWASEVITELINSTTRLAQNKGCWVFVPDG